MAKLGAGDPRWIVEDRKDGINVNNWHWTEKDVLPWAKKRLTELLGDLDLSRGDSSLQATTSGEVTVTGEALINNRKNKLISAYELEVTGTWSGVLKGAAGNGTAVDGRWSIPYLAEENADEDPEFVVSTAAEGEVQRRAKAAVLASGKPVVLDKVRQFVKEIQAGGSAAKEGLTTNGAQLAGGAAKVRTAPAAKEATAAGKLPESSKSEPEKPAARASGGRRTFKTTEKFYARPKDIFECFTDAGRIHAYTQSPAKVVPKEGGDFEIFGGSVVGKFTSLKPCSEIGIDWRFQHWAAGDTSKVHIMLEEPQEGTTVLHLTHSGIPEEDGFGNEDVLETTTNGWKQQIFHKIRAVFGYGLGL